MYSTTIRHMTATAGLCSPPALPPPRAGVADHGAPIEGWPDMHASTAIALAEAQKAQALRSADALAGSSPARGLQNRRRP